MIKAERYGWQILQSLTLPLVSRQPSRQTMTRPVGLSLRLSPQELALFHAVARARETSLSELTRALLAAEAVAAGVEVPAVPQTA